MDLDLGLRLDLRRPPLFQICLSQVNHGSNKYQVSYQGGTGNDLTLTVVP